LAGRQSILLIGEYFELRASRPTSAGAPVENITGDSNTPENYYTAHKADGMMSGPAWTALHKLTRNTPQTMRDHPDTQCAACDFEKSYAQAQLPVMREVERCVLGADYGGTSWSTREQAGLMAGKLGLAPGVRHLDVGAGSGWPGLFFSAEAGCDVTLVDMPMIALKMAQARIQAENLQHQSRVVLASGASLPFADQSFDTISHSDVLCCLEEKSEVLRDCLRVLSTAGRMVFTVISIAPGLSKARYLQAVEAGPSHIEASCPYPEMLKRCGWQVIERLDVTGEHLDTLKLLTTIMNAREAELASALGEGELKEQITHREMQIAAISAGVIQREIYSARKAL
jgi:2-polyprenyl-3-methyl-5-hydroxy-6-metoxy-1,4-benzoquinol methylase